MACYSHSKLSTFQQCKYKYKLQYIDKIKVETPDTIETFLGNLVHETLGKLYKDLTFNKTNSREDLISFYETQWSERYNSNIIIANPDYTEANYKAIGKKFISEFYEHYKPFNQLRTIGLETDEKIELENRNYYNIKIDRLACDGHGNYYVCDYKTSNKLKLQKDLDGDRQLAMYSIWIKQKFNDCKNIKLVWYFLAFDKEFVSERSDEQLMWLKKDTESLICEIEANKEFSTNVTKLCSWCKFQQLCPAWKHKFELNENQKLFEKDAGMSLVDSYAELQKAKSDIENNLEILKSSIIEFSRQHNISVVFGTNNRCSVKPYWHVLISENNKEKIISMLKTNGIYEEFSSLNYMRLSSRILKNELSNEITSLTEKEQSYRLSLSKR
ncbi:PD-(D/E)XK nuclease family protein [Candidatus Woesearchaeota archaeon]|nr:PD-(D/E)XK nuclease family protein [Candidatus Woesearchaeota archaeon]